MLLLVGGTSNVGSSTANNYLELVTILLTGDVTRTGGFPPMLECADTS